MKSAMHRDEWRVDSLFRVDRDVGERECIFLIANLSCRISPTYVIDQTNLTIEGDR